MSFKRIISSIFVVLLFMSFTNVYAQRHHRHKHNRHAPHHHYSKLPKWGFSVSSAPKKAFVIKHAGVNYHFHSGIYYKHVGNKYKVVKAPIGVRVKTLPNKRIALKVKDKKYFYYYGTFYTKASNSSEYIVVVPPIGARVDALPEGYKEVKRDGLVHFEFEGVLYKEVTTNDDEISYEVVEVKN